MRGAPSGLVIATAIAAATAAAAAAGEAGCGAFSLNDVHPADAGTCALGVNSCQCVEPPTVLAESQGKVTAFVIDAKYAYWIAEGQPNSGVLGLYRASLAGSAAGAFLLAQSSDGTWTGQLAVGPEAAYVVSSDDDAGVTGSIVRVPFDAMAPQALWRHIPAVPIDPAVSDGKLYWTNLNADVCAASLEAAIPPGDSGCGDAALPLPWTDPNDGGIGRGFENNHLAVVGSVTYLLADGQIWQWPQALGVHEPLAGSLILPPGFAGSPMAANDSGVYFAQENASGTASQLQGQPGRFFEPTTAVVGAIAVDDTALYFVEAEPADLHGKGKVVAPPPPGQPTTPKGAKVFTSPVDNSTDPTIKTLLACEGDVPLFLAVDGSYLYWAAASGQIKRVPKLPSPAQ
jgi:hypothetical protein